MAGNVAWQQLEMLFRGQGRNAANSSIAARKMRTKEATRRKFKMIRWLVMACPVQFEHVKVDFVEP